MKQAHAQSSPVKFIINPLAYYRLIGAYDRLWEIHRFSDIYMHSEWYRYLVLGMGTVDEVRSMNLSKFWPSWLSLWFADFFGLHKFVQAPTRKLLVLLMWYGSEINKYIGKTLFPGLQIGCIWKGSATLAEWKLSNPALSLLRRGLLCPPRPKWHTTFWQSASAGSNL